MTDHATPDPKAFFHNDEYRAINAARLAHLGFVVASLELPLAGKTVIELGAGIGDHSRFWLDRGCTLTITEPRPANLAILRERYPDADIRAYDVDRDPVPDETFDIVYAYGLLYHLSDPARGLAAMGALSRGLLFLESCVSFGDALDPCMVEEDAASPTQSLHGGACRPTRPWIAAELKKAFPHVYQPATQPAHPQFPTDWRAEPPRGLTRATFVAAKAPVHAPTLFPRILDRQVAYRPATAEAGRPLDRLIGALGIASVLDVGANLGQFAGRLRAGGYTGHITSFEPLRQAFAGLNRARAGDRRWHTVAVALGDKDGEAIVNVSANLFSSSLLEAEPRTLTAEPQVATVGRQRTAVRRLDSIWPELEPAARTGPVLLKLDVQGYEAAVLYGAAGVMADIAAVLMECSLVPIYRRETVLADMLPRMAAMGFHPVWIEPGWSDPATGQVYQCDVLFARTADVPRPA